MRRKLFSWHCFTHFPQNYSTSARNIFRELSALIIFKLCKVSVNPWTLCFMSYKSYIDRPFNWKYKFHVVCKACLMETDGFWMTFPSNKWMWTIPVTMDIYICWIMQQVKAPLLCSLKFWHSTQFWCIFYFIYVYHNASACTHFVFNV